MPIQSGGGTVSVSELQQQFAQNSSAFNTTDLSGVRNVSPDSPEGRAILASLGDGFPGFLTFSGGKRLLSTVPAPNVPLSASSSVTSLPSWLLIVAAVVLLLLLFQ